MEVVSSKDFKENLCGYVCEQIIITLRKSDEAKQSAMSQKVTDLEVENALLKSEVDELRRQLQDFKNHISIEPEKSNANNKKLRSPSINGDKNSQTLIDINNTPHDEPSLFENNKDPLGGRGKTPENTHKRAGKAPNKIGSAPVDKSQGKLIGKVLKYKKGRGSMSGILKIKMQPRKCGWIISMPPSQTITL